MLIDIIKKDRMIARKEENKIKYNILTLLLGQMDQSSDKSDAVVLGKIKSLMKGVNDRVVNKYSLSDEQQAMEEASVLFAYLPEPITALMVEKLIADCKTIGEAMGVVKKFCVVGGLMFEGSLVSAIFKNKV